MSMTPQSAGCVLVADDDADIRHLISTILQKMNVSVEPVAGGLAALAVARQHRCRLVMLDVSMPDMGGLEVCRLLRSDADGGVPILLMSAGHSPAEVAAGYAAGADDYLPKPFRPADVAKRVTRLLSACSPAGRDRAGR